ncbi:hypothetical protein BDN67DRAFT_912669 [Paxillus ammoniavirescens]|nr:hypothetical protein BDN67DRAFT_912669 [Paxillus ammoniavirescens]
MIITSSDNPFHPYPNECQANISIVHTNTIYWAAHLIPGYSAQHIPLNIEPHHSYDIFQSFYVNKFADHHTFEITS